jgi:hypothetical protein
MTNVYRAVEDDEESPLVRLKSMKVKSFCRDCDGDSKAIVEYQLNVHSANRQPGRMHRCYACACRRWIHMLNRNGRRMWVRRKLGVL